MLCFQIFNFGILFLSRQSLATTVTNCVEMCCFNGVLRLKKFVGFRSLGYPNDQEKKNGGAYYM